MRFSISFCFFRVVSGESYRGKVVGVRIKKVISNINYRVGK